MNIYITYDKLGEEFSLPFFQKNDGCACRAVRTAIPKDVLNDYNLFRIGTYDDELGVVTSVAHTLVSLTGADE